MHKTEFIIRKIEEKDNDALAKIIRSTLDEFDIPKEGTVYDDPDTDNLYELFRASKSVFYIAELKDEIIGCCGIYPTKNLPKDCAELVKFYILPKARGLGVGRELMQKSIDFAKAVGYKQLYLESFPEFTTAIAMYKKYGFYALQQSLGNSGHTSCNVWMLKELAEDK